MMKYSIHNKMSGILQLYGRPIAVGFLLGLGAFALFFLSDYNDWRVRKKQLKICFPLAGILLAAAVCLRWGAAGAIVFGWLRGLILLLGAVFLGLLVYTLFFAIPLEASYARPGEKRSACTTGIYALCRHPGVLWFAGLFACLWLAAGLPLQDAAVYTILNVLLVWFEDRCVFPDLLEGYEAYRASTPFLIPNGKSIRACRKGKV